MWVFSCLLKCSRLLKDQLQFSNLHLWFLLSRFEFVGLLPFCFFAGTPDVDAEAETATEGGVASSCSTSDLPSRKVLVGASSKLALVGIDACAAVGAEPSNPLRLGCSAPAAYPL